MNDEILRTIIQTVFDLGREHESAGFIGEPIDLDEFEDDDSITLSNLTLKNSLREAQEAQTELILEQLRQARYNCSSFYADGLEHAIDVINGKFD